MEQPGNSPASPSAGTLQYQTDLDQTATMVDVVKVILRVVGVVILFTSPSELLGIVFAYQRLAAGFTEIVYYLVSFAITVTGGGVMVFFAAPLAGWITTPKTIPVMEGKLAAGRLQRALLATAGAILAATTIPGLLSSLFVLNTSTRWDLVMRLAMSLWMLLGNEGVARLFRWVRTFGVNSANPA